MWKDRSLAPERKDVDGYSSCVHGRKRRSDAVAEPALAAMLVFMMKEDRNKQCNLNNLSPLLYNCPRWHIALLSHIIAIRHISNIARMKIAWCIAERVIP